MAPCSEIHQFPCLSDNYGFLLHDPDSGETACIDTPDAEAYLREAAGKGWTITQIWNTHWHPDHAGGNEAIKAATGCTITAPLVDAPKIAGIDRTVGDGDTVSLGAHTRDGDRRRRAHDGAYRLSSARGGRGLRRGFGLRARLRADVRGHPPQFWASLSRIKALPPETKLYCAHEYTASNARFALHADPDNAALADYAREIEAKRARSEWTVPTRARARAGDQSRSCAPTVPRCVPAGAATSRARPSRR